MMSRFTFSPPSVEEYLSEDDKIKMDHFGSMPGGLSARGGAGESRLRDRRDVTSRLEHFRLGGDFPEVEFARVSTGSPREQTRETRKVTTSWSSPLGDKDMGPSSLMQLRSFSNREGTRSGGLSPRGFSFSRSNLDRPLMQRRMLSPHSDSSLLSFDIDMGMPASCHGTTLIEEVRSEGGLHLPGFHHRRESFLYRSSDGSESESSPKIFNSAKDSHTGTEEFIVTPFAQILHTLRRVLTNYLTLTRLPATASKRASVEREEVGGKSAPSPSPSPQGAPTPTPQLSDEQYNRLALETLEELEWSLDQLETIQSHRSVGDLATNKFKRMLNRELSHFAESGKSGSQVSEYIFNTFLDKGSEIDLPVLKVDDSDGCSVKVTNSSRPISAPRAIESSSVQQHSTVSATSHYTSEHQKAMSTISGVNSNDHRVSNEIDVPKYGVLPANESELKEAMGGLGTWGMDIFRVAAATHNRPLTVITYSIFQERNLMKEFGILPHVLVAYLTQVENHYRPNVNYHNSLHGADVAQSTHCLLNLSALQNVFTDLEMLAAIFAAAVHDVDHPGLTNQYLVNSSAELALMYNDDSVLENHHLALAFKLLQCANCDVFQNLTTKSRQLLRRMTIDMVLATDMSKHMSLLADLKTMVETKKISGSGVLRLDNYNDRLQVLQNLIHCSDLSNPTKPLALYRQWTDRIMEEFFHQGDLERERGLDISPMCDRNNATIEKSQVGFIDYIAHPLWETWADLVYPDCQDILDTLEENRDWYQNQMNLKKAIEDKPKEAEASQAGSSKDLERKDSGSAQRNGNKDTDNVKSGTTKVAAGGLDKGPPARPVTGPFRHNAVHMTNREGAHPNIEEESEEP